MLIKQREVTAHQNLLHLPLILQRIYGARGITHEDQLDKRLQYLLPFYELIDIQKTCVRLEQALREQERILIIGDFDADGATSTALAVTALQKMGAEYVHYLVPNRFEYGYGLTPGIVDVAHSWKPNIIITVDNGITSIEGVARANELGIDVLITDHHLPGEVLPQAYAIVNPNQKGDTFKSKSIAGVGVIFYVMLALRRHLADCNWFNEVRIEPNMSELLDLVALGTIADVVALDQNNRILVNQGLARIRQGKCRIGIQALIKIAGRDYSRIRESDLAFAIAPRLNAAGRLEDMSIGIACLLASNQEIAEDLAKKLDELNQERRVIETEMKEQAFAAIEALTHKVEKVALPSALCLMDETWHQGVIGILAGRLKERYHRPVIIFSVVKNELKGSGRSIPGLNIRDALAAVDRQHPQLITKFGGHAMAAGLTISRINFSLFCEAFLKEVALCLSDAHGKGEILTDGSLDPQDINLDLADLIQQAGPWGQQFPEPAFDNIFELLDQRIVGQNHLKLTLRLQDGAGIFDAIAFNVSLEEWPNYRCKYVHAVYKLDINYYQGRTRLQLLIEALQPMPALNG